MMITLFFACFLLGLLTNSSQSMLYAKQGLQIWMDSMLPALFPFMVLTGIMIRTDMAERLTKILAPLLCRALHCSLAACFPVLIGFLCGFPLGAKTVAELCNLGKLEEEEGCVLMVFCNNISPAYLLGFVFPLLHVKYPFICLLGFYGIPFFYGALLERFTVKRAKGSGQRKREPIASVCPALYLTALEESIATSIRSILKLGGYLILFSMLGLIPLWITDRPAPLIRPFFEITSGLQDLQDTHPLYSFFMLSFGGLSCLFQTYSCIKGSCLEEHLNGYCLHKAIIALLTFFYFTTFHHFLPDLFLAPMP